MGLLIECCCWCCWYWCDQVKKYEVEQASIQAAKLNEQALAEFEAEQETMKTMSYLSEAEQQRYKDRASIAFMYAKPPGEGWEEVGTHALSLHQSGSARPASRHAG